MQSNPVDPSLIKIVDLLAEYGRWLLEEKDASPPKFSSVKETEAETENNFQEEDAAR